MEPEKTLDTHSCLNESSVEKKTVEDKSSRDERSRPWMQHWPPITGTETGVAYGFKKGEHIRIYGN